MSALIKHHIPLRKMSAVHKPAGGDRLETGWRSFHPRIKMVAQLRAQRGEARWLDEAVAKNLKELGYGG